MVAAYETKNQQRLNSLLVSSLVSTTIKLHLLFLIVPYLPFGFRISQYLYSAALPTQLLVFRKLSIKAAFFALNRIWAGVLMEYTIRITLAKYEN